MKTSNRHYHQLVAISVFMLGMLASGIARAGFTVCATGKVTTTDSGSDIPTGPNAGDTEDYWSTADSGVNVPLPGLAMTISHATLGTQFRWADPSGCADFSFSGATTGFTVVVETIASSAWAGGANNYVRLHNEPYTFTSTPGSVWSYVWPGQTLNQNTTATYTNVGSGIAKWTAFFTANYAIRKYDDQLDGTALYVGIDESCTSGPDGKGGTQDDASAHYGGTGSNRSNGRISSGAHSILLANCASTVLTRQKFIVSHEVGHAIAALFYGMASDSIDGDEPNSGDYTNDSDPARAPNVADCTSPSYSIDSKEWNAVTFREGYAHWVAASIWNDRHDAGAAGANGSGEEGSFTWFASPNAEDLERYGKGSGMTSGGRLENVCCIEPGSVCDTSWDSAGTNGDWLRFLWDFYTETGCSANPGRYTLLNIYRTTRRNGGLTKGNYYSKSKAAMQGLYTDTCLRNSFSSWANWNGVNHDT